MTISKAQLAVAAEQRYKEGTYVGERIGYANAKKELQTERLRQCEDTLIHMGQLAVANAELGKAMAQLVTKILG